jgi:hypothetical protein
LVSTDPPAAGEYVRVQLLFEGGPWTGRLLDTDVVTAPKCVAPDDRQPGAYWRIEQEPDSAVVVYEWAPDGTAAAHRTSLASRLVGRVDAIDGVRVRFGIEVVGAFGALVLAVVTLFWRNWIEVVIRVNPDRGGGALEWAVVCALAAISIGLTLAARQQWRRLRMAT